MLCIKLGTYNSSNKRCKEFNHQSILGRIKGEQPDFVRSQKQMAALICYNLAEHYNKMNTQDKAQNYYQEALKHDEAHEPVDFSFHNT